MEKPTLHYYGNLIIVEDGEEGFSDRGVNKIERNPQQNCVVQIKRNHTFPDGYVGNCYRVTFFGKFPHAEQYKVEGLVLHYSPEIQSTTVDFQGQHLPSRIIKWAAAVLGRAVAEEFLELQDKDQQSRSLYAAQAWGKSGLGEIDFMLAFWEVFSSKNTEK